MRRSTIMVPCLAACLILSLEGGRPRGAEDVATPMDPAVFEVHRDVERAAWTTPSREGGSTAAAQRTPYVESAWPRYIVEPPDILLIEGVRLVPKPPYAIATFDVLLIRVAEALPDQPIDDAYAVDADGRVNLGPTYGRVKIAGLTVEDAEARIQRRLAKTLESPVVSISLRQAAGFQAISGQHLVAMDGRVTLGTYGAVFVAGMTIEDARAAIEKKLAEKLDKPEVAVDVLAYNSKVYYVITRGGAGYGDDVVRMPCTGNETVLDAIANLGGISRVDESKVWIARPAPNGYGPEQILPVNWNDIAQGTSTATNYPLLPGDRLFIEQRRPHEGATSAAGDASPAASSSPESVALMVLRTPDGKEVDWTVELPPGATIGDVLRGATYPNPVDLAQALMTLTRGEGPQEMGRETTWAIGWDADRQGPPADDDRELQGGDRIVIELPRDETRADEAPAAQIDCQLAILVDREGDLAEFRSSDDGIAICDSTSLRAALKILAKHDLVTSLSTPRLVTTVDRPARFSIGAPIEGIDRGFRPTQRIELVCARGDADDNSWLLEINLVASVNFEGEEYAIDCAADVGAGQTALVQLTSSDGQPSPVYVAVTPAWLP